MKHTIWILLASLGLSLAACGGQQKPAESPDDTAESDDGGGGLTKAKGNRMEVADDDE